jgi:hypothetical protein
LLLHGRSDYARPPDGLVNDLIPGNWSPSRIEEHRLSGYGQIF